jgi:hypothetical protein
VSLFAVAVWDTAEGNRCKYRYFDTREPAEAAVAYYKRIDATRSTYGIHAELIELCDACREHDQLRHCSAHLDSHGGAA